MSEPDYVTINPAVGYQKFNVVVMRWNSHLEEFSVFRISQALPKPAAEALAKSWAAAGHLDVR